MEGVLRTRKLEPKWNSDRQRELYRLHLTL
jgi:hypothetical protein